MSKDGGWNRFNCTIINITPLSVGRCVHTFNCCEFQFVQPTLKGVFYFRKMNFEFKEVEIENYIWSNINNKNDLLERGLYLPDATFYRQLALPSCGICDLVSFEKNICGDEKGMEITVYELKRGVCKANDITQLHRYISFFEDNAPKIKMEFGLTYLPVIRGVLICKSYAEDELNIAGNSLSFSSFLSYSFSLEAGIVFYEQARSKKYFIQSDSFFDSVKSAIFAPFSLVASDELFNDN